MRKWFCIGLGVLALLYGCEKDPGQETACLVTLQVTLPSGEVPVLVTVDQTLEGTFFQNINTMEKVPYPDFVNGAATVRVLKGIYMLAFDGEAVLADGTRLRVRLSRYNSPDRSVRLLGATETLELPLTVLR